MRYVLIIQIICNTVITVSSSMGIDARIMDLLFSISNMRDAAMIENISIATVTTTRNEYSSAWQDFFALPFGVLSVVFIVDFCFCLSFLFFRLFFSFHAPCLGE
ncbi:MAG: hypothetical protein HC843_04340 [Sphingomonadales bacterium]|nr:hypothetical protein [Sphingomonadales bacterium]